METRVLRLEEVEQEIATLTAIANAMRQMADPEPEVIRIDSPAEEEEEEESEYIQLSEIQWAVLVFALILGVILCVDAYYRGIQLEAMLK